MTYMYDETPETSIDRRTVEMRNDLYRAIYNGDVEEAENIMNLMAMVGIDRDEIMAGRRVMV